MKGDTKYSSRISGDQGNHRRPVRFDITDGYIGITAYDPDGKVVADRVLLTPDQYATLLEFVGRSS